MRVALWEAIGLCVWISRAGAVTAVCACVPDSPRLNARPVLQGLSQMGRGDDVAAGEIGDGTRELEHTVEGTRGELQALTGGFEQRLGARFDIAIAAHLFGAHLGIAGDGTASKAGALARTRGEDPRTNTLRVLTFTPVGQLLILDAGHLDVDVDAIEQRAAEDQETPRTQNYVIRSRVISL